MKKYVYLVGCAVATTALGILPAIPSIAAVDTSGAAIRKAITNVQGSDSALCRYQEPRGDLYGYHEVPITAQRKKALIDAGATSRHIAIAMLENSQMDTSYPLYDNKSLDAANFGVFKQNWGMIRESTSFYRGLQSRDYARGRDLNNNVKRDVEVLKQSIEHYGLDRWMAGHRCGAAGLANPNLKAVKQYIGAVDILTEKVAASDRQWPDDHYNNIKRSNQRFWINVPAV